MNASELIQGEACTWTRIEKIEFQNFPLGQETIYMSIGNQSCVGQIIVIGLKH